jgi:pyridoxine 4-dehydrogenase
VSTSQVGNTVASACILKILLIPGTSSLDHLHENLAAAGLALSEEALARLNAINRSGGPLAPHPVIRLSRGKVLDRSFVFIQRAGEGL